MFYLVPESGTKQGTRLHDTRTRNWYQFSGTSFWSVCHGHKNCVRRPFPKVTCGFSTVVLCAVCWEFVGCSASLVSDQWAPLAAAAASAASVSICHDVTDSISEPSSQPVCHWSPALQPRHASSHLCRIHLHQLLLLLDLSRVSGRRRTALEGNQRYVVAAFIYEQSVSQASERAYYNIAIKFHDTDDTPRQTAACRSWP